MTNVLLGYSLDVEKLKNTHLGSWVSCDTITYQVYIRLLLHIFN